MRKWVSGIYEEVPKKAISGKYAKIGEEKMHKKG